MITMRSLVAAALVAASLAARAGDVQALYDLSGMDRQLAAVPEQIEQGLVASWAAEPIEGVLPEAAIRRFRETIPRAFAPGLMRETIVAHLGQAMTPEHVDEVLVWLRSPVGRRFTAMEEVLQEKLSRRGA